MNRDVAIVALVNEHNEVLLVRTHAYPDAWQPVGGGVDAEDDGPEAAVTREAREEIGLVLENPEKIITVPFDFGEGEVHCYRINVPNAVTLTVDTNEIAEFGWFSLQRAQELPAYPATKLFLEALAR